MYNNVKFRLMGYCGGMQQLQRMPWNTQGFRWDGNFLFIKLGHGYADVCVCLFAFYIFNQNYFVTLQCLI